MFVFLISLYIEGVHDTFTSIFSDFIKSFRSWEFQLFNLYFLWEELVVLKGPRFVLRSTLQSVLRRFFATPLSLRCFLFFSKFDCCNPPSWFGTFRLGCGHFFLILFPSEYLIKLSFPDVVPLT